MAKNLNCADMGYQCVFSITAEDDEQDLMLDTVERHALNKHLELTEHDHIKPEVKAKLKGLLMQAHYFEHEARVNRS